MDGLFHPDFKRTPYWWEAIAPPGSDPDAAVPELPAKASVVIVGGGLTGLNCAIELARGGVQPVVLDGEDFGFGASTRNGGAVSAGTNLGKGMGGAKGGAADLALRELIAEAASSIDHVESVITREGIDCHWERKGRFLGAFTPRHYAAMAGRADWYNETADAGASVLPRERQREEIASDYYFGGMVVRRAGKLHPALYHKGLADAARRHGAVLLPRTRAGRLHRTATGWRMETSRGEIAAEEVVIATNGYTGGLTPDLQRRVIPLASHIIATEELEPGLAASLIPNGRTLADTRRVLCYYRMSPDGRRVLFGGRPRFTQVSAEVSAPLLHALMLERWPQLAGTRITHAWTGFTGFTFDGLPHLGRTERGLHYAMGCNGSGVGMLSHLGAQVARTVLGGGNRVSAFDGRPFPTRPFYTGKPWFLPPVGNWYRFRDWLDRKIA